MKRVLVAGGAGFIGSCFVRLLMGEKAIEAVTTLDALTYAGDVENLAVAKNDKRHEFVHGDICDRELVEKVFARGAFDTVINFAAESHVDRSIVKPGQFIQTNVVGTEILLEAARKWKTPAFLQVSTDEVYGSLDGAENVTAAFAEDDPMSPSNPYSASKAAADLLCLAFHKTHNLPVTITRCVNNYGPYQFPEKLIPVLIQKALGQEDVPLYGTGKNIRSWIHVEDHCSALLKILQDPEPGKVFNISASEEIDNLSLAKLVLKFLGKSGNEIAFVKDRPGHDWRYALHSARLRQRYGWKPSIKFQEGLRSTVEWYQQNQEWVQRALRRV